MHAGGATGLVGVLSQATLGATVTFVLLGVLVQQELLYAHGGRRARRVARWTTLVSAPVLLFFAVVIVVRFLRLLHRI